MTNKGECESAARDAFNEMVDACIEAGEKVDARGTPELQVTMRAFLYLLGCEVARRQGNEAEASAEAFREH